MEVDIFGAEVTIVDTVGQNKKMIAEYIRNQLEEDELTDEARGREFTDPFTGSKRK